MIEWGNHWARGLHLRSKNLRAVAGLFSHIGEMQVVHHFWAYPNLEVRRKSRDLTWQEPGWNTFVMKTVPLIRSMHSSILRPSSFSPMQ
ncbi:NipSnap1 [Fasciola hepatica]|uniref:NipSnap1 n=1 Tax=Fasciola hepatica TaxID=6192 RepID=A0A4E0RAR4_FASHE|nr:NipSnap1 [Fasciola hepatica]